VRYRRKASTGPLATFKAEKQGIQAGEASDPTTNRFTQRRTLVTVVRRTHRMPPPAEVSEK
jgi:hypothetical protein